MHSQRTCAEKNALHTPFHLFPSAGTASLRWGGNPYFVVLGEEIIQYTVMSATVCACGSDPMRETPVYTTVSRGGGGSSVSKQYNYIEFSTFLKRGPAVQKGRTW
jgi:hypothetical protein